MSITWTRFSSTVTTAKKLMISGSFSFSFELSRCTSKQIRSVFDDTTFPTINISFGNRLLASFGVTYRPSENSAPVVGPAEILFCSLVFLHAQSFLPPLAFEKKQSTEKKSKHHRYVPYNLQSLQISNGGKKNRKT